MSDIRKRTGKKGISYQVRYNDPATGIARYKSFPRRKDAALFLSGLSDLDYVHDRDTLSVSTAADRWLNICENIGREGREPVEKSTLRKYKLHAKIIKEINGGQKLNALSPQLCNQFRDDLLQRYSRKYAKKILTSFKSILSQARHDGFMKHDPTEATVILISLRTSKKEENVIPSMGEVSRLLEVAGNNKISSEEKIQNAWQRYAVFFSVLIFSGMRPCEVIGLPWHEVNFDNKTVTVSQDATEDREIGLPKSGAAYRTIPMPDTVMEELEQWQAICPDSKQDLVFPNGKGKIESHGNITNRAWYPLQKQCGFIKENGKTKFALKSLRHVRASLEIHNKATAKEIQNLMGHSSVKITFDIYGHLFEDHAEERAARANKIAEQLSVQDRR